MAEAFAEKDAVGRKFTGEMLAGGASERLPALDYVFKLFAEAVPEALAGFFVEKAVASVRNVARTSVFEKLANARGRFAALMSGAPGDLRLILIFDEGVGDFAMESCFSRAQSGAPVPPPRATTTIDTFFVREYGRRMAGAFSVAFAQTVGPILAFDSLQAISDTNLLGKRDMPAIAASLEVVCSGRSSSIVALLPQSLLASLRTELSAEPPQSDAGAIDPRWLKQMEAGVSSAEIPLVGVLETLAMSLGDVAGFSVGSVLALSRPTAGRIRLECGGKAVFWGRLAQSADQYFIEIEGPIEDPTELGSGPTR